MLILLIVVYNFSKIQINAQANQQDIYNCGILGQSNTTYHLKQDVVSDGVCLRISGDNINLDLEGHTITYDNARYGCGQFDVNECAGVTTGYRNAKDIKVYNGKIKQVTNGAAWSPAIFGGDLENSEIFNLEISVNGPDTTAIYADWGGIGLKIHNNNIINNSTYVSDRHQVNASIRLPRNKGFAKIYDNTIIGGPQGGIFISSYGPGYAKGYEIYRNQIQHDERYTNGFGIHFYQVEGGAIYENTVKPTYGRGIGLELSPPGSNISVYGNIIETKARKQILSGGTTFEPYNPYWTYGIKIEDSFGIKINQNNVIVRADADSGNAHALAIELLANSNCEVSSNIFEAETSTSDKIASSVYPNWVDDGSNINITGNTFISNNRLIFTDWGGGNGITYRSNTLEKGSNPINFKTLYFGNGSDKGVYYTAKNILFIDTKLENGASLQDVAFGPWSTGVEYKVIWYLNLEIKDNQSNPIPGVSVQAVSSQDTKTGTTDSIGKLRLELTEYQQTNFQKITYNPYQIACSKLGFISQTFQKDITNSIDKLIVLSSGVLVQKKVDKIAAVSGDILQYDVIYTNGSDYIVNFTIQDQIPANSDIVPGSISNGGTLIGNTISWTLGNLNPADQGSVSFQVKAK